MQPTQNLSYAVDYQTLEWKRYAHKKGLRQALPGHLQILEMGSYYSQREDREEPIFHIYQGFEQGTRGKPSEVTDRFWLQGPTNYDVHRWEECTANSGKFCLYIDPKKIDQVWERFLQSHIKGELGMGLRCSTAKPNSWADSKYMITVHVPNCENLDDIERVSRTILKLLDDNTEFLGLVNDLSVELSHMQPVVKVHKFKLIDRDERSCFELLMVILDKYLI